MSRLSKDRFIYRILAKLLPKHNPLSPGFVQIETSSKCNLKCTMCSHTLHSDPRFNRPQNLSLKSFKQIIAKIPSAKLVLLHGVGEPLLNPEIFEIIKYAKSLNKNVILTTNGTLLTEEMTKNILDSGLDWMGISIDATTKKTYESIRVGAKFEQLLENIERFIRLNEQKNNRVLLSCDTVVVDANFEEISLFPKFLHDHGIDDFYLSGISEVKAAAIDYPKVNKMYDDIKQEAKKYDLHFHTTADYNYKTVPCHWLWKGLFVTVTGDVLPCCYLNLSRLSLGNIINDDLNSIWNGRAYKEMRERMKTDSLQVCRDIDCPFYLSWLDRRS